MDRLAQRLPLEKIHRLRPGSARPRDRAASGANFLREPHFHDVPRFASFDQAQSAMGDETPHRLSRWPAGQTDMASQPKNGKPEPELPFQAAVPQQMRIDGTLREGQAQPRDEMVFQVFPDLFSVGLFVFHVAILNENR